MQQRYHSALDSTMSQYYPLRRLRYGLMHLLGLFARKRLRMQFDFTLDSRLNYMAAVMLKMLRIIKKALGQPIRFFKQVNNVFRRVW